jgi:hypothetical protein
MRKLIAIAAAAAAAVAWQRRSRRSDENVWHEATKPVDLR